MNDLIEILMGVFITTALFYARYYYGTRAMLELIVVFIVTFALVACFITGIMNSVSKEIASDENDDDEHIYADHCHVPVSKLVAYQLLAMWTNAFGKILRLCTEVLEDDEERGDDYE